MAEKINFTMAAIGKLEPLSSGRRWTYDTKVSGLAVLTTENGAKSFYVYKKIDGKPERHRLGKFPDITVDTARELANKFLARIADGENPAEARRTKRGEITLGELWQDFLEEHVKAHKKPRSVAEDEGLWNRYLSQWSNKKLSSISRADFQTLHSKLGKNNGKVAANRMLSLASTMFSKARHAGKFSGTNPTEGIQRFTEKSRDRFLQPDEIPRFLQAVDAAENQQLAGAFRLMLFTAARKSNVLSMEWAHVDLTKGVWRIPDTKSGEPQYVPLTTPAVEVLKSLQATAKPGQPFVFPARVAGSKTGHLTDVTKAWEAVKKAAELPDIRLHDLRRTLGSWQAIGGESLLVIGKSLGHKNTKTTEVYARLMVNEIRRSMDSAAAEIAAAGKETKEQSTDGTDGAK